MNFTQRITDYIWVTVITVLVWLYAEGRNVQVYAPTDPIPVTLSLASKDLLITRQDTTAVRLQLKGATAELDKLRQTLPRGIKLQLDITKSGEQPIPLADVLATAVPLKGANVNIISIDPPAIQINVDKLVTQQVNVAFKPSEVQLVGGAAQIKPAQVALTIAESRLKQLPAEDLVFEAVPPVSMKLLPPGIEQTLSAQVKLPTVLAGDPTVKIEPQAVQLTFTIDKKEDSVVLPSVPVFIEMPPSEQDNFKVTLAADSQVVRDVKVTGPADLVAKVRDGSLRVVGTLRLFRDELDKAIGAESTSPVKFDVPDPLVVDSPVTTVRYTVHKRTPAPMPMPTP